MMMSWRRGWWILCVLLGMLLSGALPAAWAQVATTAVQDTVYRADGTGAAGSVVVSWTAFTTAAGNSVPAGRTSVKLGAGGSLSLSLAPNAGATPMGSYYTAVYHLNDGSSNREYWVVPVSASPVKLSAIRNTVLPLSVAMKTVSKGYVDTAISTALAGGGGLPQDGSLYVQKAGDTMTGPLILSGDPVSAAQAATKNYVDINVTAVASGLNRKVDELPSATQVVEQPTGTQLQVSNLNGELYATPYISGTANDGIANALTSGNCGTAGCVVKVEPTYTGSNLSGVTLGSKQRVDDERGGSLVTSAVDPLNPLNGGVQVADDISVYRMRSAADVKAENPTVSEVDTVGLRIINRGVAGGSNQFPGNVENPPYFKSSFAVENLQGVYNTQGQHSVVSTETHCYGVGDCLIGSQYLYASGGTRDIADEGAHPFDLQILEDPDVFTGTCATGCTTGSTAVTVTAATAAGSQGDGRFLIDKNPAKDITSGVLVGGAANFPFTVAEFTGTSFTPSVFLMVASAAVSQPTNLAPGTVTLPIQTTGVPANYATNTAALPAASGVACFADTATEIANFETVAYTVVDGTHIRVTANKVHTTGATLAVGGLCGYGLEETVDTAGTIRQVFPVVGASSATELYYTGGRTQIVGVPSTAGATGGYQNVQRTVAAIARTGGVVTVTLTGGLPGDLSGTTFTVSGVADASYNGNFVINQTGNLSFTYASAGPDSTSTGGAVSFVTGAFVLYPMAEILSVMDPATKSVNGYLQLAANTVAWAAGDAVEVPHYYQEDVAPDTEYVMQLTPHPVTDESGGITYQGVVTQSTNGWTITNAADPRIYLGDGGTHVSPSSAYRALGKWRATMSGTAGDEALFSFSCNSHGCSKYDSTYNLFELQSSTGIDAESFAPQTDTVTWTLGGAGYSFAPSGFTAGTINVGTLNATNIAGGVSGGSITSGTINAARLPVFGPSGTTHSPGAVPDPGPVAGNTRFLREDGTFAVPAAGGGGGGAAGGDLSGSFPNPLVTGLHVSSGFADGLTRVGLGHTVTANACDTIKFQLYNDTPVGGAAILGYSISNSSMDVCLPAGGNQFSVYKTVGGTPVFSAGSGGPHPGLVNVSDAGDLAVSGALNAGGPVTAPNLRSTLTGTTATIGGTALAAGACTTGTATVTGATVGVPVSVAASDGSLPAGNLLVRGAVTAANTVTVQVCAVAAAATPAAVAYNVRVLQ